MNIPPVASIRNVAVVSHMGSGKTSLVEALAYCAGRLSAPGSASAGTTVSDFEPEERHHGCSLHTSVLRCVYRDHTVNLLDTPGSPDFVGELFAALRVADGVVLVVDAAAGIRSDLQRLWRSIRDAGLPCLVFLNGLDHEGIQVQALIAQLCDELAVQAAPLSLPIGAGAQLSGVVEVLRAGAQYPQDGRSQPRPGAVPAEYREAGDEALRRLTELVAESDDRLLEHYLSAGGLSPAATAEGLREAVQRGALVPIIGGSALRHVGLSTLWDAVVDLLPSPAARAQRARLEGVDPRDEGVAIERRPDAHEPFSGLIFKTLIDPFVGRLSYVRVYSGRLDADHTLYNAGRRVRERGGHLFTIFGKTHQPMACATAGDIVAIGKLKDSVTGDTLCDERTPILYPGIPLPKPLLSFAVEPAPTSDMEKVSLGLHKLIEEDPSLAFVRRGETHEMVLSGMGPLHIETALEKLSRKYGAEVTLHAPKVAYRETIRSVAQAQGKHKKQTGGHGQYGDCWVEVGPLPRGAGFEFANHIVGGAIPRTFVPAVEKGVLDALQEGPLAGFPVVDVQVGVYDGSYHVVDSSELAFKIAGSLAVKQALMAAHPMLLEPFMKLAVDVPTDCVGGVLGDLNARRGRIVTVVASGRLETITAVVPQAELPSFAQDLNALTAGRGSYSLEPAHYEEVPRETAARIVEAHRAEHRHATAH